MGSGEDLSSFNSELNLAHFQSLLYYLLIVFAKYLFT